MSTERASGDRRHISKSEMFSLVMLGLQFGALVWGASEINSSVKDLRETVRAIQTDVKEQRTDLIGLKVDVGVLKSRQSK